MKTKLFIAKIFRLGADGPSEVYFDSKQKAIDLIKNNGNGDLYEVTIISKTKLNYSDGCCWHDLTGFNRDINGEKIDMFKKSIPYFS